MPQVGIELTSDDTPHSRRHYQQTEAAQLAQAGRTELPRHIYKQPKHLNQSITQPDKQVNSDLASDNIIHEMLRKARQGNKTQQKDKATQHMPYSFIILRCNVYRARAMFTRRSNIIRTHCDKQLPYP